MREVEVRAVLRLDVVLELHPQEDVLHNTLLVGRDGGQR
jgi:hypothetical protein